MIKDEHGLQRRVAGYHDIRMDGMTDLVLRAKDSVVLDIGCNRGLVAFEFANNGARVVHGCDNYAEGIATARHLFADLRNVRSHFEVVDLTKGGKVFDVFGKGIEYDIVLMLATLHKLRRVMEPAPLSGLMCHIATITRGFFAWRGTSIDPKENEQEIEILDRDLKTSGLGRIHTSYISRELGAAAIWERR
jgi:SAM-dependent methyltransferase